MTAKWNQEIGHPIKIVISGGGDVNQTTIAHIRKDKIKIQFFIITVEDRPSTIDNIIYSFIIGLSIGAAIVAINLLIFRKRYRPKSPLPDNSHSLITF